MLWTIIIVVFVLWLLGAIGHIGGDLIHLLLVLVLVGILFNLFVPTRK